MYFLLFIVIVSFIVAVACLFVTKTTVRIEKLEIGYEEKLHEMRPYLAEHLPLFCHYLIKPKRTSILNDPLAFFNCKYCMLESKIYFLFSQFFSEKLFSPEEKLGITPKHFCSVLEVPTLKVFFLAKLQSIQYTFFFKKHKFKKHVAQNAEILRNIARLTLTNITEKNTFFNTVMF